MAHKHPQHSALERQYRYFKRHKKIGGTCYVEHLYEDPCRGGPEVGHCRGTRDHEQIKVQVQVQVQVVSAT